MLIFNTTYLVPGNLYHKWNSWLHEQHIPAMLNSGYFNMPQIAKVVGSESERGTSYAVQFHVENTEMLDAWNCEHADAFLSDFKIRFGQEILYFSTVLEIIE